MHPDAARRAGPGRCRDRGAHGDHGRLRPRSRRSAIEAGDGMTGTLDRRIDLVPALVSDHAPTWDGAVWVGELRGPVRDRHRIPAGACRGVSACPAARAGRPHPAGIRRSRTSTTADSRPAHCGAHWTGSCRERRPKALPPPTNPARAVTVVVCTRDRCRRLKSPSDPILVARLSRLPRDRRRQRPPNGRHAAVRPRTR